ncbi:hypothetical protein D3C80_1588780 [compost metagenome]
MTGELTQEGGNDKSRDTPATKASTDKQIADVVVGTGEMSPVIHGHEAGQFPIDLDQERAGGRVSPVLRHGQDVEESGFTQL